MPELNKPIVGVTPVREPIAEPIREPIREPIGRVPVHPVAPQKPKLGYTPTPPELLPKTLPPLPIIPIQKRPPTRPAKSARTLAQWQTPIRSQGDRDTCWAFGCIAALEALYVREFGVSKDLDLSEQYFAHIGRSVGLNGTWNADPVYLDTWSTLWGGGGNSGSASLFAAYCVPPESAAPYLSGAQQSAIRADLGLPASIENWQTPGTQTQYDQFNYDPRIIPLAAYAQCQYGASTLEGLADNSVDSIRSAIAEDHEVIADITTGYTIDSTGRWVYGGFEGDSHTLLIIGYDDNDEDGTFLLKNSWGGTAYTRVSYDFFTHSETFKGGAILSGPRPLDQGRQLSSLWLGPRNQNNDGHVGRVIIHRTAMKKDTPTKLGNFYDDKGVQHFITGYLSDDAGTMSACVADQPGAVDLAARPGQPFETWVFGTEPDLAAGVSVWEGQDYGVQLSRVAIPSTPASGFEPSRWIGEWAMDHDGHHGILKITGIDEPTHLPGMSGKRHLHLTYSASGQNLGVTGSLVDSQGHHAQLTIDFPGGAQQFDLFFHTWTTDLFSGWTVWSGNKYGVIGRPHVELIAVPPVKRKINR